MKQFNATLIAAAYCASAAQAFLTSKYSSDFEDTVPECWAERPAQCGEAPCESGEWCRDGECEKVRSTQCPRICSDSPEGEPRGLLPGRYCSCVPQAELEAIFCGPEEEAVEEEGEGDMEGEGDDGEDVEEEAEEEQEEEEEAEPIETTGEPFAGIDLNQNGIDDFEEFVPPPEDCSCIAVQMLSVYFDD